MLFSLGVGGVAKQKELYQYALLTYGNMPV